MSERKRRKKASPYCSRKKLTTEEYLKKRKRERPPAEVKREKKARRLLLKSQRLQEVQKENTSIDTPMIHEDTSTNTIINHITIHTEHTTINAGEVSQPPIPEETNKEETTKSVDMDTEDHTADIQKEKTTVHQDPKKSAEPKRGRFSRICGAFLGCLIVGCCIIASAFYLKY